jgi:FlaA1/EpsC-like NDP-sugar epimerase
MAASARRRVGGGGDRFRGRCVLVTGGTGTLGQAIVLRLLEREGAAVVRVYSRDESKQFEMAHRLERWGSEQSVLEPGGARRRAARPRLRFLIGDVRDRSRLSRALDGVDYVFHTAALKHVPGCEYNPTEAVKTNILGVQNLVEAAVERGVRGVVNLSTDKAASPNNTMGASKLMGEKLVIAGNYLQARARTVLSSVRFGNVLGSRGSALPLLREQIAAGGPVTVTDPEMTRFLMSRDQAVDLCFRAMAAAIGGEVFVRRMPSARLGMLVRALIAEYAPAVGRRAGSIGVRIVGRRPGETLHEEVLTEEEAPRTLETADGYVIKPTFMFRQVGDYEKAHRARPARPGAYTSGDQELMGLSAVRRFIRRAGLTRASAGSGPCACS